MKKLNFADVVGQSIDLIGQIADYYAHMIHAGYDKLLPQGRLALDRHAEFAARFNDIRTHSDNEERLAALFRDVRAIINPVQSAMQNVMRQNPRVDALLYHDADPARIHGDLLLGSIIHAKEDWAFIEAHPQVVFHSNISRPQTAARV
jgi:predicted trehalose synthase